MLQIVMGVTESKTLPRHYRDEVAVENFVFRYTSWGTQRVPRNTVTVANIPHMHITIRNLCIASGLRFFFHEGIMEENLSSL